MDEARRMRIVVFGIGAALFGEAQNAHRRHHHFVASRQALEQVGYLAAVHLGHLIEVGQVGHRALVLDQHETLAVEIGIDVARVADRHLCRLQRHEVLLVRVGVEVRLLLGAFGITDRRLHVFHASSNSSVSIVGLIAS